MGREGGRQKERQGNRPTFSVQNRIIMNHKVGERLEMLWVGTWKY